jgi:hypothetical protein
MARCVFLPFRYASPRQADGVEVTVAEMISNEQLADAADAFAALPGPHVMYIASRSDGRVQFFIEHIARVFAMTEGASASGYTVVEEAVLYQTAGEAPLPETPGQAPIIGVADLLLEEMLLTGTLEVAIVLDDMTLVAEGTVV